MCDISLSQRPIILPYLAVYVPVDPLISLCFPFQHLYPPVTTRPRSHTSFPLLTLDYVAGPLLTTPPRPPEKELLHQQDQAVSGTVQPPRGTRRAPLPPTQEGHEKGGALPAAARSAPSSHSFSSIPPAPRAPHREAPGAQPSPTRWGAPAPGQQPRSPCPARPAPAAGPPQRPPGRARRSLCVSDSEIMAAAAAAAGARSKRERCGAAAAATSSGNTQPLRLAAGWKEAGSGRGGAQQPSAPFWGRFGLFWGRGCKRRGGSSGGGWRCGWAWERPG